MKAWALLLLLSAPAPAATPEKATVAAERPSERAADRTPTISERVKDIPRHDGFVPFYWDARKGQLLLEHRCVAAAIQEYDDLSAGLEMLIDGLHRRCRDALLGGMPAQIDERHARRLRRAGALRQHVLDVASAGGILQSLERWRGGAPGPRFPSSRRRGFRSRRAGSGRPGRCE